MKYLKKFNESLDKIFDFLQSNKEDIKDICFELEDEGFRIRISSVSAVHIMITKSVLSNEGSRYEMIGEYIEDIHSEKIFYNPLITDVVNRLEEYAASKGFSIRLTTDGNTHNTGGKTDTPITFPVINIIFVNKIFEANKYGESSKTITFSNKHLEVVENKFKEALENGISRLSYGVPDKYHLYDNYYQYADNIFELTTREDMDGYEFHYLRKLEIPPHVFKENIIKRIEELDQAFNKIE